MQILLTDSKEDEGWVDVKFPFDWDIVNIMRGLETRKFDRDRKVWQIPYHSLRDLKEELSNYKIIDKTHESSINIIIDEKGFRTSSGNEVKVNSKTNRLLYLRRPRDGFEYGKILESEGYNVRYVINEMPVLLQGKKNIELFDFQKECMSFLRKNDYNGLIALEMGLGKTIISCQSILEIGKGPVLIVAPSSLLNQWQSALKEHYDLDSTIITSKFQKKKRIVLFHDSEIVITNYELLKTIKNDLDRTFELMVLDECQRIKNWKTQNAQAIASIVSKRVIGLSGTPVENHLFELYNIVDQIKPAFFGTLKEFKERHIETDYWGSVIGYANLEEVYDKVKDIMYRKKKNEINMQLPEVRRQNIFVDLSKSEKQCYNYITKDMDIGDIANAKVFSSSSTMKMDLPISSKEKELLSILETLPRQVVIFSSYKKEVKALKELIQDRPVFLLHGDIPKEERQEIIDEFIRTPDGILIMTNVGVYGLDKLQTADTLINFDLEWTNARMEQRLGRIHRIGSKHKKVLVINMISAGTIDHHIHDLILSKKNLSDITVDGARKMVYNSLKT